VEVAEEEGLQVNHYWRRRINTEPLSLAKLHLCNLLSVLVQEVCCWVVRGF
jgi:hypothetical protein